MRSSTRRPSASPNGTIGQRVEAVHQLNEFEIIERYFSAANGGPDVLIGIGDDAAVLDIHAPLVVAVDTLTVGVHFPEALPAHALGHRVLAVNLSDFAAMGATPKWCTLSLSLPAADPDWLAAFSTGLLDLAAQYGVQLVGGDTVRGPLTVTLQLLGTVVAEQALKRGDGQVGDNVYVTGSLGDAAAGLALMQNEISAPVAARDALVQRFCYPSPRVSTGLALVGLARAAIDISDGLMADLAHVAKQSGCAAVIELEALPMSQALLDSMGLERSRELALFGGDDYELCFTAAVENHAAIEALAGGAEINLTRVGRLQAGQGVELKLDGRDCAIADRGYRHF